MIEHREAPMVEATEVIYSRPDAVRALAMALVAGLAEGNTDMVCDCPEEYPTRKQIQEVFENLHQQALDSLDDYINELRTNLEQFLERTRFTASVRRMEYDAQGQLTDVAVDLKFD